MYFLSTKSTETYCHNYRQFHIIQSLKAVKLQKQKHSHLAYFKEHQFHNLAVHATKKLQSNS